MDPNSFPEDLSNLSDDDLQTLHDQVVADGAAAGEAEELTDDSVARLEALATQLDAVLAEQSKRTEAAAERAARRDAAAQKFNQPEPGDHAEEAPVEDAAPVAQEPALVAAPNPVRPDALAARRPAANAPSVRRPSEFMQASGHAVGLPEGHRFATSIEVAEALTRKRSAFGVVPQGTREFLSIATGAKEGITHVVGHDAVENFAVLRDVQAGAQALVASSGYIAPLTPLYDFFRLAEPQNPVEAGIPVVQAPRGGIRYIQPVAPTQASGALDGPYAANADYSGANATNYATLSAPTVVERQVEAITQSVRFDNLQYKVFPEQVQAFMEDTAVLFQSKKEVYFLDYVDTNSTAATADFGYGAGRSLLRDWTLAAVAYRKRNRMRRDAMLTVVAPDWAMEAIRLDLALDAHAGLALWEISDAQVMAALRVRNLDIVWHNDAPTSATTQKFDTAQAAGALRKWPTAVIAYFYAPGTFVRLDGGTLDVGLVRDSALNRTNDVEIFMEEWIGAAKLGLESVKLTSTIIVNGAGPNYVTAATATA